LVNGLSNASYQGFANLEEAVADYLEARERGWVRVVRLPGDSTAVFGPKYNAEDMPL